MEDKQQAPVVRGVCLYEDLFQADLFTNFAEILSFRLISFSSWLKWVICSVQASFNDISVVRE